MDIILLYDDNDTTLPQDGISADGWISDSAYKILEKWGTYQNCSKESGFRLFNTPYSNKKNRFRKNVCRRKEGCEGDIVYCMYKG